jgi:indolepyruvate ferredoxin oxidoreductase beta subunit
MKGEFSTIICGVGGQGIVLLSNIVGGACADSNLRIVTGEQHGLSQRSGSVSIHLRIGESVRSPLIPVGMADAIVSLEAIETLRYIEYLKESGLILMNSMVARPVTESAKLVKEKKTGYFEKEDAEKKLRQVTSNILVLDALDLAKQAGNPLTENVVLLGALSVFESFPVPPETIRQSISRTVPQKAKDANLKAFELGAKVSQERFCKLLPCRKI